MSNGRNNTWGVIFDVDGTMVDNTTIHRQSWYKLCRHYQIPMNDELYSQKVHARSNDQIVPKLFGEDVDEEFIKRIEYEKESLYRRTFQPMMKPTAGLPELLESLKMTGIPCGAASNSPKDNVDFVLDGLNIRSYFQAVFYRDHVQVGKPNPQVLLMTAEELGLSPQQCVLFEDSASGFKAARAAKMPYVVITEGGDPNDLPEAHDAKMICKDFTEVNIQSLAKIFTNSAQSKTA